MELIKLILKMLLTQPIQVHNSLYLLNKVLPSIYLLVKCNFALTIGTRHLSFHWRPAVKTLINKIVKLSILLHQLSGEPILTPFSHFHTKHTVKISHIQGKKLGVNSWCKIQWVTMKQVQQAKKNQKFIGKIHRYFVIYIRSPLKMQKMLKQTSPGR